MAEELPSLQIDTDWKKQAQAEKKRLVEEAEAAKKSATAAPATPAAPGSAAASNAADGRSAARNPREVPPASFSTLVQSLLTQTLYYLGELGAAGGGEGAMNLDLARHQLDLMSVIDEKTKGNLSADEQKLVDTALYEARMRFVSIASQML